MINDFFLEENWLKTNPKTIKKNFYHMLLQQYIPEKNEWNYISCSHLKCQKIDLIYSHHNPPEIKYVQHDKNTCIFSSLASDIYDAREHVS